MKRFLCVLLVALALVGLMTTVASAEEYATVVSDNGLRVWLRTTPNGNRIQLYRPGTAVTILSYGDEWHYISIGGVRGYMMSRYISVTPAPAPSSKMVEAVSVNYPSPVVDDVLQASVTPSDATVTYSWKVNGVEQSNSATLRVLNDYIGKPINSDNLRCLLLKHIQKCRRSLAAGAGTGAG